jgi:Gpi18-like mannosyltransferase
VLALSFLVRFLLFPVPGYQGDLNTFEVWFNTAAQVGPRTFYNVVSFCDYPPFNIYLFWGFGSLANALSLTGTAQMAYVIKLVPNLFDLATAGLIFAFVRKRLTFNAALLATALYAFNPAVVFNGAVWGQFDAIYTFFLVLSVMLALASKPELSAVTFTLGVLTKPQGIALAPLIAYLILRQYRLQWRRLVTSLVAVVATVFVVILPFEWSNPVTFLSNIYFSAYNNPSYQVTSLNAFNMWALGGLWVPDGFLSIVGWVLFGCLAVFTLYVLHKRFKASGEVLVLFSTFVLLFAFFMLPTRIHERYLFPAISMLALMFPFVKKSRLLYGVLTGTLFVNVAYVLYWLNAYTAAGYTYSPNLTGDPVVLAVSLINLVTFMYVLILMWDELKGRTWLRTASGSGEAG